MKTNSSSHTSYLISPSRQERRQKLNFAGQNWAILTFVFMWITNRIWKNQHFQCKQNKSFALNWNILFWLNLNILFHSFSVKEVKLRTNIGIQYPSYISVLKPKPEIFPSEDTEKLTASLFFPLLKLKWLHEVFLIYRVGFVRKCLCQCFLVCKSTLKKLSSAARATLS